MSNKDFSFFRAPGKTTIPESSKTLSDIYLLIKGDEYKERTEALRRSEGGEYRKIKTERFDFVTFGGVFDYRSTNKESLSELGKKGLLSSSGYLTLDIDHVPQSGLDLERLKLSLLEDNKLGLRLLFVSPGGEGLKLVFESLWGTDTPEIYKSEYYSLCGYLHEIHEIPYYIQVPGGKPVQILDNTPDITRTCFLPHDEKVVLNLDSSPFNSDDFPYTEEDVKEDSDRESGKGISPERWRISPEVGNSSDWKTFKDSRLIPAIFERVDELFPDMDFRFYGSKWMSPYKIDGTSPKTPRRDKTVITSRVPERVLEQGESPLGIIDFYMQKNSLSFSDSVKVLSKICGLESEERELRIKTAQSLNKDHIDPVTMKDKEILERQGNESQKWEKLFSLPRTGEMWEDLSREPEGFRTSYYFGEGDEREPLIIPAEGLTMICGLSSHFKSTLLRNLALQMTEDEGEGDIIYFTLEDSIRKTRLRLLCAYSGVFYKKARKYAKGGGIEAISIDPRFQEDFISKSRSFESFLTSGKLRIFDSPDSVPEIISLLDEYGRRRKIKGVFIDYLQRLKSGRNVPRLEDMRLIAEGLQGYTKRAQIPVIVAAQLNRLTSSPLRMGANNIAESADLTRSAETIVCLWNSQRASDITDDKFIGSKEETRLQGLGFVLGTPGTIYAKITKNKEGESEIESILRVEGKSGQISGEDPVQKEEIKKPEYNL